VTNNQISLLRKYLRYPFNAAPPNNDRTHLKNGFVVWWWPPEAATTTPQKSIFLRRLLINSHVPG
jgi:hypothetical protein